MINSFADSDFYLDLEDKGGFHEYSLFTSLKGRMSCVEYFLKHVILFPFAIVFKSLRTLFRLIEVIIGFFAMVITFASLYQVRSFFKTKANALATDIIDWVMYPFCFFGKMIKAFLGAILHPKIFFS